MPGIGSEGASPSHALHRTPTFTPIRVHASVAGNEAREINATSTASNLGSWLKRNGRGERIRTSDLCNPIAAR